MEKENCLNGIMYPLERRQEIIQWILLSILIFIVPMLLPQLLSLIFGEASIVASNSQYIVGVIVNTVLITIGINVKGFKEIVGLITLPSISAMCSGLIFKSASIYSIYMIPIIWIGNFSLIYMYKKLVIQKKFNYVFGSTIAIITKASFIYLGFRVLTFIHVIPSVGKIFEVLNISMGINQVITASVAAIIGFGINKVYKLKLNVR